MKHPFSITCFFSFFKKNALPITALLFIGMTFVCSGSFSAAHANPLLGNKGSNTQTVVGKPTAHQSFFSKIVARTTLVQMQLRHKISSHVKRFNNDKKLLPLLPLFFITFAYGALHAAGPGHGKAIAMSYALGTKHTYLTSLLLGPLIAFIHASSAILFVLTLHVILHKAISTSMTTVTHISQMVSYSLITLLGLYLFCSSAFAWFGKTSSQSDHAPGQPQTKKAGLLPVAFAIGAVPCPGVVMVLLFCFSLGQIALGVLLGLSVSLGMAVTITLAILVSFSGRHLVLLSSARWQKGLTILEQCFHTLSGILVTLLGAVLLASVI